MKTKQIIISATLLVVSSAVTVAVAQGTAFTYQGRLNDSSGPYTGSAEFQPTLWNAASAGSKVADNSPVQVVVTVTNGLFVLPLDFGNNFPGTDRWLQLEVRTTIGSFSTLSPRQALTPTPYALTASTLSGTLSSANLSGTYSGAVTLDNAANNFTGNGSGLNGLNASQLTSGTVPDARIPAAVTRDSEVMSLVLANDGTGSGLDADLLDGFNSAAFVRTNGPVTISGSNNAAAILTVSQAGAQNCILATTASTDVGEAAVTGRAGSGPSINSVAGVFGTSATGRGIIGSSSSQDGVLGYSTSGRGVHGQSPSGNGVEGRSFGSSGAVYGVRGEGQSSSGAGVYGESSLGNGVEGYASNTSGAVYGVKGESRSSTGGAGVRGDSTWVGVWGDSSGRWGVYGRSTGTSNSYGVYGTVSAGTGNYAGYFSGNAHVTGTLSKGAGSFKIDHPLDPTHQYLSHSFVESPDMMNVYNGNVTLDEMGTAWVTLPAYFEALNRDFRYQLTPIGGPGPNLHVAEPVRNNAFKVAGGTAGLQVSWQVTGVRQDAFANANRIVVEEAKPDEERGRYLHPGGRVQPTEPGLRRALDTDPCSPAK